MKRTGKKLTDVLADGGGNGIRDNWNTTAAAGDDKPIPRGEYICHAIKGELFNARTKGTPGYEITFQIIEGVHAGRRVWHDLWLTPAALPHTKRDLAKLGITELEQLEQPLPPRIRCKVTVVIHTDDDNIERNKVLRFEFIGVDPEPANPYAPAPDDQTPADPDGTAGSEIPV